MDQYLLQILKETNTIIIPDLGALTITNADKNEVMFMSFLKHDDGKLSAHIAEKEGIDENEAKNIVSKHVREIKTKLDQGETYAMFEFGTFLKGDDGEIEFENWTAGKTEAKPAPKPAPTPVVEPPKKEEKTEAKIEEPKKAVKPAAEKPVAKKAPKKEETKETTKKKAEETPAEKPAPKPVEKPKPEPKKETPKPAAAKPKKEEPKKPEPKVKSTVTAAAAASTATPKKDMNIAEKEELSKSVDKMNDLKKQQEDGQKKKKKGAGFYILMVLILVIVAGGTYVAIDYDNVKQHIPFLADKEEESDDSGELDEMKEMMGENDESDDSQESSDDEQSEETDDEEPIDEEPIDEEPVDEEPVDEKPVVSPSSGGSYHIVAGAFGDENNATRLAEKLKGMGYPATTFKRGASTIVSVQSYSTKAEAQSALKDVTDAAPKGWVLKWE